MRAESTGTVSTDIVVKYNFSELPLPYSQKTLKFQRKKN
jgi:hypothetical protein